MVNVEYIHKVIEQQWDISIPYNPKLENPKFAANMKYLLTAVDVANEMLNGKKTTDYGNSEYATLYAADTIATNEAVARLIQKEIEPAFFITTTPDTSSFGFYLSAKGKFLVDWGDGKTQTITRDDTNKEGYSHNYDTAGEYKIGIGGQATEYSTDIYTAAIAFYKSDSDTYEKIASIDGSLGAIFGTIGDGGTLATQPRFYSAFSGCSGLTQIPSDLFAGIHGAPVRQMFCSTFWGCSGLTEIPSDLFAGIQGAPAEGMFHITFSKCSGLTKIPSDLFAGIQGAPARDMFDSTFSGCSGLRGEIPSGLFAGIQGAPARSMFYYTFSGCSGLTGIPSDLFGDISGNAQNSMFGSTFSGCSGLTGPSAKIGDKYLYEIWPDATWNQVSNCYSGATGLSDYSRIPYPWK